MIQPAILQSCKAGRIEADRRGDQVGVKPGVMRRSDDLGRSRRDAGSPPDRCTCNTPSAAASSKHSCPGRGIQFVARDLQARADSNNTDRPSGQRCVNSASKPSGGATTQAGRWDRHPASIRFATSSASMSVTSSAICGAIGVVDGWQVHRRSAPIVRLPSQRRRISLAGPSVSITRSGPSNTHASRVVSKCSRTPGRKPRAFRQIRRLRCLHSQKSEKMRVQQQPPPFAGRGCRRTQIRAATRVRDWRALRQTGRISRPAPRTRIRELQLPGEVAVDFHADADFAQLRACPGHWMSPHSRSICEVAGRL